MKNDTLEKKSKTQKKARKILRLALSIVLLCVTVWFFLPAFDGTYVGMPFGALTGLLFLLCAFPKLSRLVFKKNRIVSLMVTVLLAVGGALAAVTCGFLLFGAGSVKNAPPDSTVIVLGCQVHGETPSLMLQRRMDAALVYVRQNPESKIIASGGQGRGENISEAECIRRYLVANGIDDRRIYVEDRSANTEQNISFSAEIIAREGLTPSVVIVTSRFHQYRASLLARQNDLDSSPFSSDTKWVLVPSYWAREIVAVWRVWILGY